jgi:glycosyltransferase involved in cell wall biosynthesis
LPFTFGYLGKLTPEKGIELLLDMFGARKDGGWELLVAGEGDESYCQELHRRYATLEERNAIRFLGWTDPLEFFPQIDVLVVPSLWQEPLPRVILEAYAYGVPVIGSRRGGILELIEDGVTGFLFNPSNPQTLATLIDRLLQDRALSGQLGQSALRRAQEYIPARIASEYQEAYRAVLESTWA